MSAEIFFTMLATGIILLAASTICIHCWEWYSQFWNKKLNVFEFLQWTIANFIFGLLTIGILAWIAAFVGIILNILYKIIL